MGKVKAFLMLSLIALGYSSALAALSTQDRAIIPSWQLLVNPGFESGTQGWTASGGTFTTTTTAANVGSGLVAGSWDSSAASQTLTSSAVTIPSGAYGRPAILSCNIQTPSGSATHKIQAWDGTNVLAEATIQSSTQYRASSVMFEMPGSGSIRARLISVASNEPSINVDDCAQQVLQSDVVVPVAQASLYGSLKYAGTSGCVWLRTANASFADFSADTDCATPTVTGLATAPSTKIPAITFNNMPPGDYSFIATSFFRSDSPGHNCSYRFSDGTNGSAPQNNWDSGNSTGVPVLAGRFSYTTSGTRTISIQATGTDANHICAIDVDNPTTKALEIQVYRFPSTAETGVRPDVLPASWSGYHDNTCSFTNSSSGSFGDFSGDASCNLVQTNNTNFGTVTSYLNGGNPSSGIVITPSKPGAFLVTATTSAANSSGAQVASIALTDGNNTILSAQSFRVINVGYEHTFALSGIVYATSISAVTAKLRGKVTGGTTTIDVDATQRVSWSVVALNQSFPAPLLVGSVTSNSSGLERVERLRVTNSGTPTIASQSGSWVSGLTDNAVGSVYVNLTAGNFSADPTCTCSSHLPNRLCSIDVTISTSQVRVRTATVSPFADADMDFSLICMGPR